MPENVERLSATSKTLPLLVEEFDDRMDGALG